MHLIFTQIEARYGVAVVTSMKTPDRPLFIRVPFKKEIVMVDHSEKNRDSDKASHKQSSALKSVLGFLTNRLLLALLAVSLLPLAFMAIATYRSASDALQYQVENQIEVVRTITAKGVERYFSNLEDQLRVAAEDRMFLEALTNFRTGFNSIIPENSPDAKNMTSVRRDLETTTLANSQPNIENATRPILPRDRSSIRSVIMGQCSSTSTFVKMKILLA